MSKRAIGLGGLLLSIVLANLVPVFSKSLYDGGWTPAGLYFATLLILSAVMASHEFISIEKTGRWQMTKHDALWTIVVAITGGIIDPLLFFTGLAKTPASDAIIATSMLPFFIVCFAVLFLKERFSWQTIAGGILVTAGVVVILLQQGGTFSLQSGSTLIIAASVFGALTTILHKKYVVNRSLDSVIFVRTVLSTLVVGIYLYFTEPEAFAMLSVPQNVWLFTSLPLAGFFLPYFLYFNALKHVTAVDAGIMAAIGRVIGVGMAAAILGERLTGNHIFSLICVVVGVLIINVPLTKWRIVPSRLIEAGPLRR